MKTKYKVSLFQRPHCPYTHDTNFIANFEHVIEILKGIAETVPNPNPFLAKSLWCHGILLRWLATGGVTHLQKTYLGDCSWAFSSIWLCITRSREHSDHYVTSCSLIVPRSANLEKDLTTACVIFFFFSRKTVFVAGMKLREFLETSFSMRTKRDFVFVLAPWSTQHGQNSKLHPLQKYPFCVRFNSDILLAFEKPLTNLMHRNWRPASSPAFRQSGLARNGHFETDMKRTNPRIPAQMWEVPRVLQDKRSDWSRTLSSPSLALGKQGEEMAWPPLQPHWGRYHGVRTR